MMLRPIALDGDDHPLGRIDVDVLAESANRRKSAAVDAGRPVWQRPPRVAVSPGDSRHQPTEGGGRAVGLAGEIAPAGRHDPPATKGFTVLHHQQAEAAEVAQARADAGPAQLLTIL